MSDKNFYCDVDKLNYLLKHPYIYQNWSKINKK